MNSSWEEALEDRKQKGLFRSLRSRAFESDSLYLDGNDYLNLSRNEEVIAASQKASHEYGTSSTGSPLVSGYTRIHEDLEKLVSEWYGGRPTLLWNTGYSANQSILSNYPQKGDLVVADRLIHNSMISGILKSGAMIKRYAHLDLDHLEKILLKYAKHSGNVFVVTESVFSMDGDYPQLQKIADLKKKYSFHWILDEAHAIGWYGSNGAGLADECHVLDAVDTIVGTMGKGIGSMGAFTVFRKEVERDYFINFAGEYIYSTYLSPPCVGASIKAIQWILQDEKREQYRQCSREFRKKLKSEFPDYEIMDGDSPIIPIVIGETENCVHIADSLKSQGVYVGCIRPPTVPDKSSRLRVSINSDFTQSNRSRFIKSLQEVL